MVTFLSRSEKGMSPGSVAQLVGVPSCTPKGGGSVAREGTYPGLRLDPQLGRVQEDQLMFLSLKF